MPNLWVLIDDESKFIFVDGRIYCRMGRIFVDSKQISDTENLKMKYLSSIKNQMSIFVKTGWSSGVRFLPRSRKNFHFLV